MESTQDKSASKIVQIEKEVAKKDFNKPYAYSTWVPSMGYLYGERFPGGEVVLAPMTVAEEKILQQAGKEKMEIVDTLIQRCLLRCPVPYEDLLLPDMLYLLLVIRNISFGSEYLFHVTCDACGTDYSAKIQLPRGLETRVLGPEDDNEPWQIKLPVCEDLVQFRLLRVKDEADIRRFSRQAYRASTQIGDPGYTYRLAKHFVTVNGKTLNPLEKLSYVESMHTRDSTAFRNAIEARDFGVKLSLDASCPSCGKQEKTRLPFDKEFFRPSNLSSEPG